mmetsp:Transcript_15518/g.27553  ORF Transcript_15518/g.27553 Transcript_15518/m.27553 type:complete len:657 (-) Transcript_15518:94-2064(-)
MAELQVGQHVTLDDGRVGHVKFIGNTSFASGEWVGVELDSPLGKNSGTVAGVKYFGCKPSHGSFVRRGSVKFADDSSKAKKTFEGVSDADKIPAKTQSRNMKKRTTDVADELLVEPPAVTKTTKMAEVDSDDVLCEKTSGQMQPKSSSFDEEAPKPKVSKQRSSSVRRKTATSVSVGNASAVVSAPATKAASKKKSSLEAPAAAQKKPSDDAVAAKPAVAKKKTSIDSAPAKPMKKASSVSASKKKLSKSPSSVELEAVPPPPPPKPQRPQKLFTAEENIADKLVGVVVTISGGSTYDPMFKEVKPTTVPGERVSTYTVSLNSVWALHMYLKDFPLILAFLPFPCRVNVFKYLEDEGMWINLVQDIGRVPADSVVFNWECCSDCGDRPFPCCSARAVRPTSAKTAKARSRSSRQLQSDVGDTMKFMGYAVHMGWTAMCSDFSLKSLLHEWSEDEQLGPNPFTKLGTCSGKSCLEFVPSELQNEDVPQQLQVVGELCKEQGKAMVQCLGSTILYTVNPDRKATELYDLKVLTIVTDYKSDGTAPKPQDAQSQQLLSLGEGETLRKGFAGHVTLTYKGGGQLITSMGHWIELSRIDTSVEDVMRVAEKNFGEEEVKKFRKEFDSYTTDATRSECVQSFAKNMVSKSAPSRMKARTKFG